MRYGKVLVISALLLGTIILIGTQFSIPTLFGADGYLHIRMAQFIRQYGLKYDFHWARYSIFAKNFADKDLLYHCLLIPFTFSKDIFLGAKVSACVFAIFLYLVFFLMLQRYSQKGLIPFFLIIFFCSPLFLQAISRPRNMVLIIALTLIYIHFLIHRKYWALFGLTIVYALGHVSSPLLLVFAFLCELVRFINERKFVGKSILAVTLGLVVGFLIHPHFPNNLLVFYLNGILVPIYALKWGLELGAEFFPLDTRTFILDYPFILIGLVLLIAGGMSRTQNIKLSTKIWMCIAGFFFVFSFFSRRYIIHSYPVILIALAGYFSDWYQSTERFLFLKPHHRVKIGLITVAWLVVGFFSFRTYRSFIELMRGDLVYNQHYEAVGKWMSENIPQGEVVFHANWSDSQYLIGLNPKDDYFVTLDPIYMYYWNPNKYKLYRDIAFGQTTQPYLLLKDEFGVRYGYAGKNYFSGLISQIRADQRFEVLAEDGLGVIFRLK